MCIECSLGPNPKMLVIEPNYASLTILLDNTTQSIKITPKHRFFHNHIITHNDPNGPNYTNSPVMTRNHLNTLNDT